MAPVGCTFSRGRVVGSTTEAGAPARVSGQFAQVASCAVRNATSDRVRIAAPSSAITFAVVGYLDPDNAHDGASMPASGVAWDWRASADERYTLQYDKSGGRWQLIAVHGGTAQTINLADTFTAGAAKIFYVAGDASTLYLAVDGGTIGAGTARTQQPEGLPSTMDVGSVAAASQIEAAFGAVAAFSAPLSQTQWESLAALRAVRPPLLGEGGTDALMTVLWYGAHPVVWTLPASGVCIDLNHLAGAERFLESPLSGSGPGPSLHRLVESPLRDGVAYVDTRGRSRLVVASVLLVSRSTVAHQWELRRELAAAVSPRLGEGVLMYAPGEVPYETAAILADSGASFDDRAGALAGRASLPFLCSAGDWSGAVRDDDEDDVPAGGWEFPWEFPWEFTDSAVDISVENAGDANAYPEIVITAGAHGCTAPSIENVTAGKTFGMRSTFGMEAGEVLVVDMSARTALLDGVNVMGQRDPDTSMWALVPGTNELTARAAAGSATVSVRHRAQYGGV